LKAKKITPEQYAKMKEIFNKYDRDRDGRITKSELEEMLSQLGIELNDRIVDYMVSLMILFVFYFVRH
jgi:Ca2+-binding EF-hand superfamily protein